MARAGFTYLLQKHAQRAAQDCPSLREKSVSPHVLRHTCAMMIYQATGDLRKVSLWLGHADMQATEVYVRADPTEKLDALDAIIPPALRRGKFTVPDRLIAMLHGQYLCTVIGGENPTVSAPITALLCITMLTR